MATKGRSSASRKGKKIASRRIVRKSTKSRSSVRKSHKARGSAKKSIRRHK